MTASGEDSAQNVFPPCPNVISFHTGMLMSYMVTDEAVQCGYADLDDCRPVVKSPGASEVNE